MSAGESFPNELDRTEVNDAAVAELFRSSAEMCSRIIEFTRAAYLIFLEKDRDQEIHLREPRQEDERLEFYVTEDILASPSSERGKFVTTLALRFENPPREIPDDVAEEDLIEGAMDVLYTYWPVAEDFSLDSDPLPDTDVIYLARKSPNLDETRYSISPITGFGVYSTLSDGEEVTEFDVLQESLDGPIKRVDSGLPALASIFELLVNREVVPQKRV